MPASDPVLARTFQPSPATAVFTGRLAFHAAAATAGATAASVFQAAALAWYCLAARLHVAGAAGFSRCRVFQPAAALALTRTQLVLHDSWTAALTGSCKAPQSMYTGTAIRSISSQAALAIAATLL
jgi:hypothetical protein